MHTQIKVICESNGAQDSVEEFLDPRNTYGELSLDPTITFSFDNFKSGFPCSFLGICYPIKENYCHVEIQRKTVDGNLTITARIEVSYIDTYTKEVIIGNEITCPVVAHTGVRIKNKAFAIDMIEDVVFTLNLDDTYHIVSVESVRTLKWEHVLGEMTPSVFYASFDSGIFSTKLNMCIGEFFSMLNEITSRDDKKEKTKFRCFYFIEKRLFISEYKISPRQHDPVVNLGCGYALHESEEDYARFHIEHADQIAVPVNTLDLYHFFQRLNTLRSCHLPCKLLFHPDYNMLHIRNYISRTVKFIIYAHDVILDSFHS